MIEERFVGSIDSPEDRKKLRWLAPPILIGFVLLGAAIDASNGIITTEGPIAGVLVGTPVATSVVEYSVGIRTKRRFNVSIDESYQEFGIVGRWFVILLTATVMCGIVGLVLYLVAGVLLGLVVGIWSLLFTGSFSVNVGILILPALILSGLVTSVFLGAVISDEGLDDIDWSPEHDERESETVAEAVVSEPGANSDSSASEEWDSKDGIREALATAESHIEHGRFTSARSALNRVESATSALDEHPNKTDFIDKENGLWTRLLRAQAYQDIKEATEALDSGDTDAAARTLENVVDHVESLEQYDHDAAATIRSDRERLSRRLESLREQSSDGEAHERLAGVLESLEAAQSQAEQLLGDGQYEEAARSAASALDTASKAEQLNETYDLGRDLRLDRVRSDLDQLKQDAEAAQAEDHQVRRRYEEVRDALAAGEINRALGEWKELAPKPTVPNDEARTQQSVEYELFEEVRGTRQELTREAKQDLSVAASLFDDGDYEGARQRSNNGLDVCEDVRSLNETFDIEAETVEGLENELERLSGRVDAVLSTIDEADSQRRAVERALQSRDHEAAENALEELEHRVEMLVENGADEEVVADLRSTINDLERELAVGKADGRVTGLLGSAMSSYSTATSLLDNGERERAVRRLESARGSLDEASTLNQEYTLGRSDSIHEKHEKVNELLDEATEAPRETLEEQLLAAESEVARGIDDRETDDVEAAVGAFERALNTYEEALETAAGNDLDAVWEVEQRASMAEEYLDLARSELEGRQDAVRNELDQILDDGESALISAEQHEEVDDLVSAREAFEETIKMIDDAAQLVETGMATADQEKRYGTLDRRVETLRSGLPESSTREYRNRDLVDALQRLTVKLGESPRPEFVNSYGEYPADAYLTAFGSWSDALAAANLDPIDETKRERRTYSRTEVLDALVDLTDELGSPPSRTEMNRRGAVSSTTVTNRVRDWDTALELAETALHSDEPEAEEKEREETDERTKETDTPDSESTDGTDEEDILGQLESELNEL